MSQRASHRIWDLDWSTILPWAVGSATVELGTYEVASAFIADVHRSTFNIDGRWLAEPMTDAKKRFFAEMDVKVFRDQSRIVGVLAAHPLDWSTYYYRWAAFAPDYRDSGLLSEFGRRADVVFRDAGIARLEADTSPGNVAMTRFFASQGWIVTATNASERWGLCLRYTKFIDEAAERHYRERFLDVPMNVKKKKG